MPVGFLVFVIGWIFLIVIAFGFPYSTKYGSAAVAIFSLFPWSLLSKGIQDLAAAAESEPACCYCHRALSRQLAACTGAAVGVLSPWLPFCRAQAPPAPLRRYPASLPCRPLWRHSPGQPVWLLPGQHARSSDAGRAG